MKLVGFNFTKFDLEKKTSKLNGLKITTGIDILDIEEINSAQFKLQDTLLLIKFEYAINYEKDIASLKFRGNLALSIEQKQAKEILKQWKEKTILEEVKLDIFNIIFKKSSLRAIQFEEEFNLPPHIPFPFLKPQEKKD